MTSHVLVLSYFMAGCRFSCLEGALDLEFRYFSLWFDSRPLVDSPGRQRYRLRPDVPPLHVYQAAKSSLPARSMISLVIAAFACDLVRILNPMSIAYLRVWVGNAGVHQGYCDQLYGDHVRLGGPASWCAC